MSVVSDGGDDQEDSSSISIGNTNNEEFQLALDEFREKWQKEIKGGAISSASENVARENTLDETDNEKSELSRAEKLFMQGVDFEKRGKVFDALSFYRRAVQIVPDIEFRIYESTKGNMVINQASDNVDEFSESALSRANIDNVTQSDDEDLTGVDLLARFQTSLTKANTFIQRSNFDRGVITTGAHISDLPVEILLYIFKWVMSSDLDVTSLGMCSKTCKGFYVCAMDEEIWRLACLKVWGVENIGDMNASPYCSWRQMFIERQRVHFNGCYISKTSYQRYGENSFQDQFYRPVQVIEYYRYMRFFPNGKILAMTTADEPAQCVGKLKSYYQMRPEILKGHYRLHGNLVIIALKRNQKSTHGGTHRKNVTNSDHEGRITFYIELNIVSSPKRRFYQLQWKHYSIIQVKNKIKTTTDFDLTLKKYPPLYFSRVKSYNLESEAPLQ